LIQRLTIGPIANGLWNLGSLPFEMSQAQQSDCGVKPARSPLMRMRWLNLAFIHWPVPVELLRSFVPTGLEIETFSGQAWVGLVPFSMRDVLPAAVPRWPGLSDIPAISAFHECNVRTYVHPVNEPDQPGIWFFSLDAASRAAVWGARRFFHLPYYYSRISLGRTSREVEYAVDRIDFPRATMRCHWTIENAMPQSQPGDLEYFLTERLMLFSADQRGNLHRCRIRHDRWMLRKSRLLSLNDSLLRAAGIAVDTSIQPLVHAAEPLDVHAWPLERV
jgi:uncharacterized protein